MTPIFDELAELFGLDHDRFGLVPENIPSVSFDEYEPL